MAISAVPPGFICAISEFETNLGALAPGTRDGPNHQVGTFDGTLDS